MLPQDKLYAILKSGNTRKKRKLLLTQIGYLRINIFGECYEQIQQAQEKKDFDQAVKLMGTYAEKVAIPYISTKKQPEVRKRLKKLFSTISPLEPSDYIQKWKNDYEAWFRTKETEEANNDGKKRMENFDSLKKTFFMLYTVSFSVEDFPPLRYKRSDE
jgi:hypothetical protein